MSYVRMGSPRHRCVAPRVDDPQGTLWRCHCGRLWIVRGQFWKRAWRWAPFLTLRYLGVGREEVERRG